MGEAVRVGGAGGEDSDARGQRERRILDDAAVL